MIRFPLFHRRTGGLSMQNKSGLAKFYTPWFVAPALILFSVFFIVPNAASFVLAFTDWSLFYFDAMRFNGLMNFRRLFTEPNFWICIRNTFHFAVVTVVGKTLLGFLLALLVQREGKLNRALRSVIFLPITISSIVVAIVFVSIYNPGRGLLNSFLEMIGLGMLRQDWLFDARISMWSICAMEIWQWTGFNMLIFIAGLKNIPREYYEAAEMDGATYWQRTMRITVPLIAQSFTVTFINSIISGMKVFAQVYGTTNGGPADATQVLGTFLYKSFGNGFLGYSAAVGLFTTLLIVTMTMGFLVLMRRQEIQL